MFYSNFPIFILEPLQFDDFQRVSKGRNSSIWKLWVVDLIE